MATVTDRGLAPIRHVLENGCVVIAKGAHALPAVTLQVALSAGNLFDPDDRLGSAFFVSRMLERGTRRRSADDIAEALDSRGVSLTANATRHTMLLSCTCLADDFEAILALMADLVREPVMPDAEIEKRRAEILTLLQQDADNPAVIAVERLMAELYPGGHPYGRRARGTPETIRAIGRDDLLSFHARRFAPSTTTLVVVGDVRPDEAVAAAERAFGDWNAAPPPPPAIAEPPASAARRTVTVPMMNKAQADIAYGFTTIRRSDPDYYACWVMNNVLGQYALGGRLGNSIRERQGMAYYVFSALDANIVAGPLLIRAGVDPANVDRAVQSIDDELTRAVRDGITSEEVAESKQYLVGSLPRTLETNTGIAGFLQMAEFFGLGPDYDVRLPSLLRAVAPADVNAAARRLLDPGRATVVVAGPYEAR
jgi:zinc protease